MTPPEPQMLPNVGREIMENRHRKLIKLEYNREKSLADHNCAESHDDSEENQLLPYLDNSSFSELELSRN